MDQTAQAHGKTKVAFRFDDRHPEKYLGTMDNLYFIEESLMEIVKKYWSASNDYQFVENPHEELSGPVLEAFMMIHSVIQITPIDKELLDFRSMILKETNSLLLNNKGKVMLIWKNILKNIENDNLGKIDLVRKRILTYCGILPVLIHYFKQYLNDGA